MCVIFRGCEWMVDPVGVSLDVEVYTLVGLKCMRMGRPSYVGQVKIHNHGKVGVGHSVLWW